MNMKSVRQNMFLLMVSLVVANLFSACSNEQTAYLDEDTNLQDTKVYSVCEASSSQMNNTDYEIIPIGSNSCVYVPKMTSAKTATRSAEAVNKTYSANVSLTVYDKMIGPVEFTISWDSHSATFSMPDNYSYAYEIFQYSIDGNVLTVDRLSFEVVYQGKNLGRFVYIGTLRG